MSNFSALINGTVYSTTNGTITTEVLDNSTSLWNITVDSTEAGGYYQYTYRNYNVSSNLQASIYQSIIEIVPVTNRVSGEQIYDFQSSTSSNGGSATGYIPTSGSIILNGNNYLNVSAANDFTVQVSKSGYYSNEVSGINTSPETKTTASATLYDHRANFTLDILGGGATDQNFTIDLYSDDYDFHEQLSTTSGSILANLTHGNYTVWLNDSQHELKNVSVFLNSSTNYTDIVIDARTARTFDIAFYNETSSALLDNETILVSFISDSNAFNRTTSNGTLLVDLLTPDEYEIQYRPISTEETVRSYFVTLGPQSYENLSLYLIDEDISSFYVARVLDESGSACQEQTVSLLRYYIEPEEYRVVQMARTDSQGQAVFRVRPNTVDYKLLFSGPCGSFESSPTKLIDSINTFTVFESQNYLEGTQAVQGADTGLVYVNSTRTFSYSWTSSNNIITEGCLEVTKRKAGVRTIESEQCSSGMTGSLVYTIPANETNQTTWYARGYLDTSTSFSTITTDVDEVSFLEAFFDQGAYAPFAALIIFVAMALLFGTSASSLVVGTTLTLLVLSMFYFVNLGWGTLSTIIILAGVILYRLRTA